MLKNAAEQCRVTKSYSPAYVRLDYPMGDVKPETGVCADVIVRAFRAAKIDLQKELHVDMRANFAKYPKAWGLKKPDTNIDHRRVLNLEVWFTRKGKSLKPTDRAEHYLPGDVVSWRVDRGRPHIGIVSASVVAGTKRPLVIHNIGAGTREEDILFAWDVVGHYRHFAPK